jgi:molybdate transport system ATP-binding protein
METFHLTKRKEQYPSQLSGGQQQRVALARILASDTDILLLDEPFSALDYYLKEQLQEQMLEIIRSYGKDVIMVTHNRDEAFRFCPDLLVMDHGNVVCEGKLKDIFKDPKYFLAARLTGCKNFSKAEKVSEHEIYAIDWEMRLHVEEPIPEQLSHVGIRAHYMNALPEIRESQTNVFEPEFVELMEDPFEINVMVRNKKHTTEQKHILWWKLSKEQWYGELHEKVPKYLELPEKNLILLI